MAFTRISLKICTLTLTAPLQLNAPMPQDDAIDEAEIQKTGGTKNIATQTPGCLPALTFSFCFCRTPIDRTTGGMRLLALLQLRPLALWHSRKCSFLLNKVI